MNRLKRVIGIVVAAVVLLGCQSSKNKLNEQITLLEKETTTGFDVEKLEKLSSLYREYINKFPQDNMVISYLFKSGTVNLTLKKGSESLSDFTLLIDKFPQSPHLAEAYYYRAFVYEDLIYDIASAKAAYSDFISRFPDHEFVSDAKLSIQYLGMSPEEIVASFGEKETEYPVKE